MLLMLWTIEYYPEGDSAFFMYYEQLSIFLNAIMCFFVCLWTIEYYFELTSAFLVRVVKVRVLPWRWQCFFVCHMNVRMLSRRRDFLLAVRMTNLWTYLNPIQLPSLYRHPANGDCWQKSTLLWCKQHKRLPEEMLLPAVKQCQRSVLPRRGILLEM